MPFISFVELQAHIDAGPDHTTLPVNKLLGDATSADSSFSFLLVADGEDALKGIQVDISVNSYYGNSVNVKAVTGDTLDASMKPSFSKAPDFEAWVRDTVAQTECLFMVQQAMNEVMNKLSFVAPIYVKMWKKLKIVPTKVKTLCVYWHPGLKQYIIEYNPNFIMYSAICDYFYNRSSFDSFKDAFYYFVSFGFCHEILHILYTHVYSSETLVEDIPGPMLNRVGDVYINLELSNVLSNLDFVKRVTYPSTVYVCEDVFHGHLKQNLQARPPEFVSLLTGLFRTAAGSSVDVGSMYGLGAIDWKDGKALLKVVYPKKGLGEAFGGKSFALVQFINAVVNGALDNAEAVKKRKQDEEDQKTLEELIKELGETSASIDLTVGLIKDTKATTPDDESIVRDMSVAAQDLKNKADATMRVFNNTSKTPDDVTSAANNLKDVADNLRELAATYAPILKRGQ